MKLLELRSPTTLTPQTPLPLTPSARQFVVPTTKLAPPPSTTAIADATKDTSTSEVVSKDVTSQDETTAAVEKNATDNSAVQDVVKEDHVSPDNDMSNVLSTAKPEVLPPANNDVTSSTNAAEGLFPIDFPNSDHQVSVDEDHMITGGTEEIQQPMEFETSNQISSDMAGSPDPTAFNDFNNMGQFDQSEPLTETNQSGQLAAGQSTQLPQQSVQSNIDAHQLEHTS